MGSLSKAGVYEKGKDIQIQSRPVGMPSCFRRRLDFRPCRQRDRLGLLPQESGPGVRTARPVPSAPIEEGPACR